MTANRIKCHIMWRKVARRAVKLDGAAAADGYKDFLVRKCGRLDSVFETNTTQ